MPPRTRQPHTSQDVTDISSVDQLLRYATAAQLAPLEEQGYTQEKIAVGAGLATQPRSAGPVLSKALNGSEYLTTSQLHGLDQIIGALTLNRGGAGSLSSLALRLDAGQHVKARGRRRGEARESTLEARIPPSWTRKILTDPPADEIGVLMQASALLSEFMAADKMDSPPPSPHPGPLQQRDRPAGPAAHPHLVAPPTSRNYDAQILLGMLASYAFEQIRDRLESQLRDRRWRFRVWRAITKLVRLSEEASSRRAEGLGPRAHARLWRNSRNA